MTLQIISKNKYGRFILTQLSNVEDAFSFSKGKWAANDWLKLVHMWNKNLSSFVFLYLCDNQFDRTVVAIGFDNNTLSKTIKQLWYTKMCDCSSKFNSVSIS